MHFINTQIVKKNDYTGTIQCKNSNNQSGAVSLIQDFACVKSTSPAPEAIVGIVAGAVIFILAVALASYFLHKRKIRSGDKLKDILLIENAITSGLGGKHFCIEMKDLTFGALIAQGGMGQVYAGKFQGADVAIKELYGAMWKDNSDTRDDFFKEAELLASLHHPHIIQFFGVCVSQDSVTASHVKRRFIVTKLMPTCLADAILTLPDEVQQTKRLAMCRDIASALSFIHSAGVIHRDIKPQNVLMDQNKVLYLCDFGIARKIMVDQMTMTANLGTLTYSKSASSPGAIAFDTRGCRVVGIFFGVVCLVMLTVSQY